jgi:pSer/pThr/pTyr-binding forkhead associated (FHA) protein
MKLCLIANKGAETLPFDIEGDTISIGRSSENDIQIRDRYVSHRHLIVWKRENGFFLKNVGNRNGTTVNGSQIPSGETVEVKRGDKVEIGKSMLYFWEESIGDMYAFLESLDLYKPGATDTSTAVMGDTISLLVDRRQP